MGTSVSLRVIAVYEAAKGLIALLAASGMALHHRGPLPLLHRLALHLHLNPGRDHPNAIIQAIEVNATAHLRILAFGVLAYALLRFVEAAGLWFDRRWAEWMGAVSAAVYLPFEILELVRRPSVLSAVVLVATALTVLILAWRIRRQDPAPAVR
ncbi:MAG: DUF2127 domain-containing protein [Gemmatimonadales bacterium]